ncbi:MAG TPA: uroporphyrinogen decarboxylase family protein [Candidatus Hydrogenedentes bacterium]|nr:uroporphyrinogen decarboxylase family protein [Candidatus Hydrogenedentota bacterium]HPG69787.1 uroporphyrinogen decarboxylase family protein [Candidatus Hydrogenedentota bacterium]
MNVRERFHAVMHFQPVDRLPVIEWATWWDQTIARWHGEGLPEDLVDVGAIADYFGHDCYRQMWLPARRLTYQGPSTHGGGVVSSMDEYAAIKQHLYPTPEEIVDHEGRHWSEIAAAYAERQKRGEMVVWITLEGFFWFPRTLLGIEEHFYAFYEQPELMHGINRDLLEYQVRMYEAFCEVCVPDFMTFAEDMSYNHGPMISRDLFDEFMAPYYRRIIPRVRERGTIPVIDTDGEISQLVPWFIDVGVDGFLPLERQAGCDLAAMREVHPKARFIGAFDKMVMNRGEGAVRAEFERLLPVMRQGGYIPSVDHQTPPGVSLDEYRVYLALLREYAERCGA